jgi:3-oxoadipate enol-lactonase
MKNLSATGTAALHFIRTGPRGQPPVVLLHAVGMDLTLWDHQIDALHHTYDVVALDLPGHGLSAGLSGELSFSNFAAVVAQLIEGLGVGPVHVVGISFGSMVAQTLALEHPALVRSLSLIGAAGTFAEAGRAALRARADFVRAEGLAAVAPLSLARWFTPTFSQRRPDVLDRVTKILYQQQAPYHAALWDMIATLDTLPHLQALALPALVIVGAEDTSTPLAAAQALAEALQTTNLHIVPHSAHFTNLDAREAVGELLLRFFNSLR